MKVATHHGSESGEGTPGAAFAPIDRETRAAVDTAAAARHLNRRPQTLRHWACSQNGPLQPLRINGRLAWPVADIKRLLGVA